MVTSAGRANPASTSIALMIPTATGQPACVQCLAAMRKVRGPAPLNVISWKGSTCVNSAAIRWTAWHSLSIERVQSGPSLRASTVVVKPHIPGRISAFANDYPFWPWQQHGPLHLAGERAVCCDNWHHSGSQYRGRASSSIRAWRLSHLLSNRILACGFRNGNWPRIPAAQPGCGPAAHVVECPPYHGRQTRRHI